MRLIFAVLVVIQLFQNVVSFDIWKTIEESNKDFYKKQKGLSDDNGHRLVGGDIFMTTQDFLKNRKVLSAPPQNAPKQKIPPVFDFHRKYWKRRIPYQIGYEFNTKERQVIQDSMKYIEARSCLKFSNSKTSSDKHWIRFYKGAGCHSGIGRSYYYDSKSTDVSLGNGCVVISIIVHELLHSLGFFHEQSRTDRDSYLQIYLSKVDKGWHSNFDKNEVGMEAYHGTPYDLRSIMQYGKSTFRKASASGNVMESKGDPDAPIGNSDMSDWDITELNRRYQCQHVDENGKKHVAIMSGWSQWVGWTRCMENWRKECSKARYRFCVDSDNCPGGNKWGTDEDVIECSPAECKGDKEAVDGVWSRWSAFTSCSGKCGWGIQQRTRKCDNPPPRGKGRKCFGNSMERKLCRKQRCSAGPDNLDQNFDSGFGAWTAKPKQFFARKNGRASYQLPKDGPSKDHTSQVTGRAGYYIASFTEKGWYYDNKRKRIIADLSVTTTQTHAKACLSFHYMLNGLNIISKNAISVYWKTPKGEYINSAFNKGGNIGKNWHYATVNMGRVEAGTKIYIEFRFEEWRGSVIAVDDIVFDNNECPKYLDSTKCADDPSFDCKSKKNMCVFDWRVMIPRCCHTCSDPSLKITGETCLDNPTYAGKCKGWTEKGECAKNKNWMAKQCCVSCKSAPKTTPKPTLPPVTTTTKTPETNTCVDIEGDMAPGEVTSTKCEQWANKGYCEKYKKFMLDHCCRSCENYYKEPACTDNASYKDKCDGWASKEISECAVNSWMPKNCCVSCKTHCDKDKHDSEKCKKWAKEKFCTKDKNKKWMAQNCCFSCKTYGF
uniref:Metalloendopeptidase n=1 Tax=Clytia hemisphaerica TaxID=252671 RepID=A0A7M5X434_9CNID